MAKAVRTAGGLEDKLAKHFDKEYSKKGNEKVSHFLISEFGNLDRQALQGGTALDIGCGSGSDTIFMASTGIFSSAEGIDFSEIGIRKARDRIVGGTGVKPNFILGNFISAKLEGSYSLIFVSNVLEYVAAEEKKAFMDKVMELTRPGGINMICFASSLPRNFIERLIEYRQTVDGRLPVNLFPGSEDERAIMLNFELGILNRYKEAGWSVIGTKKHEGERNFVGVQIETVIVQKPLADGLPPKRT